MRTTSEYGNRGAQAWRRHTGDWVLTVVGSAMENDAMAENYEHLTSDLLKWIESTIEQLSDRKFYNSLIGVQQQLAAFSSYRTVEKPPKFAEKVS